jgi:hypothetical protein
MIRSQSEPTSPQYHNPSTLWGIYKFCSEARETDASNKDRKVFVDFVMGILFTVRFFKDLSLLSHSHSIDNTSKRFKYYLGKCSKLICGFLNPGFEMPSSKFATQIVLKDGFVSMDDKEENIQIINLITVEGNDSFLLLQND